MARSAALAAMLTAAVACSKKNEAPKAAAAPAVPVALAPVKSQPVQRAIEVVGTLFGDEDTVIAPKVAGKILSLSHDMGDMVQAGEPLAQIEQTDYALAVAQAELSVKESLAKIGLKDLPAADFDPAGVPTVQRAKVQTENAQAKFNRAKQLFEQQPPRISEQEFDDLKTALSVAHQDYDVAALTARATLEEARARRGMWAIASQKLRDTTVRAPDAKHADGSPRKYAVAGRMVSVGVYVKEGETLFRLVDDDMVKLRAAVPERHAPRIAIGQPVSVSVESSTGKFEGKVARINPQIDPANRTFEVEISVPNPKRALKPGAFARALIQTHVDSTVYFVPQDAVVSFAGVNKVFTVADKKAQEIRVDLGDRLGDWIEITNGLTGKEEVVVAGTSKLATGVAVEVKPLEATRAPDGAATQPKDDKEQQS